VKRVALLLGVTALVVWMAGPGPLAAAAGLAPTAMATVQEGETSPYYVCEESQEFPGVYQCVEKSGCGTNECESDQDCAVGGCDPGGVLESQCINEEGGSWDPDACQCIPPPCTGPEQECINNWGSWDADSCTCSNECNPGPPQLVGVEPYGPSFMWCTDCYYGLYEYDETSFFVQFCEDGQRVWDQYSVPSVWYFGASADQCGYLCLPW